MMFPKLLELQFHGLNVSGPYAKEELPYTALVSEHLKKDGARTIWFEKTNKQTKQNKQTHPTRKPTRRRNNYLRLAKWVTL